MRGADGALPHLPRARGDLGARARCVIETRWRGRRAYMKREGWDDPLAKDGRTLSGWLLTLFEVRAEHSVWGLGFMTPTVSCKAGRNAA